jgi:hypothetical protein
VDNLAQGEEHFMAKPNWIEYRSDSTTRANIRKNLTGIRIDFDGSKPKIEDGICMLPGSGAICPIGKNKFVFKHTQRIKEYERGYWVGTGTPGYGQEWLSSSNVQYLNDDDQFFLGRERILPPNYRYKTEYYYSGEENGTLFLNTINGEHAEELENDIELFIAKVE